MLDTPNHQSRSLGIEIELITLEGMVSALEIVRCSDRLSGVPEDDASWKAWHAALAGLFTVIDATVTQTARLSETFHDKTVRNAAVPAEGEAPLVMVAGPNAERLARLARRWSLPSSMALSHALETLEHECGGPPDGDELHTVA